MEGRRTVRIENFCCKRLSIRQSLTTKIMTDRTEVKIPLKPFKFSQYERKLTEETCRLGFFKYSTVENIINEDIQNVL